MAEAQAAIPRCYAGIVRSPERGARDVAVVDEEQTIGSGVTLMALGMSPAADRNPTGPRATLLESTMQRQEARQSERVLKKQAGRCPPDYGRAASAQEAIDLSLEPPHHMKPLSST